MDDKSYEKQNYWLTSLDTALVWTNQSTFKKHRVVKPTDKRSC